MLHAVLAVVSNCCPPLKGRFLTRYSPVRHCPHLHLDESSIQWFSFDLHVLSTPPAFVLSQDQTLNKIVSTRCLHRANRLSSYFHSFIQLFASAPGNWLNPGASAFCTFVHVWCFVRSLFNLQGTLPAALAAEHCYYTAGHPHCQGRIFLFLKDFFDCIVCHGQL